MGRMVQVGDVAAPGKHERHLGLKFFVDRLSTLGDLELVDAALDLQLGISAPDFQPISGCAGFRFNYFRRRLRRRSDHPVLPQRRDLAAT